MRNTIFLYIAIIFSLCSCSEKKAPLLNLAEKPVSYDPGFTEISDVAAKGLEDSVRQFYYDYLKTESFSGGILVAKNGRILFEHYPGIADHEEDLKMGANIPVHVASISKTVTAVAVLRLVDQGKISLDAPVSLYIKKFPYKEITIRTLLNHRSGLPYYGYFDHAVWPHNKTMTNKDLLMILNSGQMKLNFPPDSHFAYCNTNYAVLALIVEKITHKKFPNAMRELIFDPLKMEHSFIYEKSKKREKFAKSYNSRGVQQEENYIDLIYGDKNLYTTPRDLLKFDCATYSDTFLSKASKSEMFRGYSYEKEGRANYGLGIRLREEPGRKTCFFHTGWWHGNTGCYTTLREDTVCMVVLSNHYTRRIFAINALSVSFGDYPYARLMKAPAKKGK
jgi:CubicO group peptidase (beta-lactamase class C family)